MLEGEEIRGIEKIGRRKERGSLEREKKRFGGGGRSRMSKRLECRSERDYEREGKRKGLGDGKRKERRHERKGEQIRTENR